MEKHCIALMLGCFVLFFLSTCARNESGSKKKQQVPPYCPVDKKTLKQINDFIAILKQGGTQDENAEHKRVTRSFTSCNVR